MVQEEIVLVKFCCNAAIAVSSFVFMVDGRDLRFHSFILSESVIGGIIVALIGAGLAFWGAKINEKSSSEFG